MPKPQKLGSITSKQMAEIDRTLQYRIGIPLVASIERVAHSISSFLINHISPKGSRVLVLAGAGLNGADALATARYLAATGRQVITLIDHARDELVTTTQQQLTLAEQFGVRVFESGALLPDTDLILDGLIGYGLVGTTLAETTRQLIEASASYNVPRIALDIPTGIDATTGHATTPAFRASTTIALAYPKSGLIKPYSPPLVGELLVLDTGVPARWWQRLNQPAPDFSHDQLIAVHREPTRLATMDQ